MASPQEPTDEECANLVLERYLRASEPEIARILACIVNETAMPIIRRVLARKVGPGKDESAEVEDVASEAKARLIERLLILRADTAPTSTRMAGPGTPIKNLAGYIASVAYSAWAQHLSRMHPARAILGNQLRHLLEDQRGLRGFACWQGRSGERWCGLAVWQRTDRHKPRENAGADARIQRLIAEPMTAAREALEDKVDPKSCALETLLTGLFLWLGAPVEWHDLAAAIFHVHGASWKVATGAAHENAADKIPDSIPTPHDEMRWKEYMQWLWKQVGELPLRQRTAYLLHTHTVFEWEAAGIASASDVADRLGLSPGSCAELWNRLPLDDLAIAKILACTRQQVINLRRVARDTLGQAWQRWISEETVSSPETARSNQVISPSFSTPS